MSNAASPRPASPSLVEIDKRGRPKHLTPTSPEYYTWYDEKGKRRQYPRRELDMLAKRYANDPTVEVTEVKCDRCREDNFPCYVQKPGFGKAKRCYTCCTGSCSFFKHDTVAEPSETPTNLTYLERAIGGLDAVLAGPVGELAAPLTRVQENLRNLREQLVGGPTTGGGSGVTGNGQ
ncbi:hypothetical protein DB88DRAFT_475194 [Papiliotrema laurentii]|uniref:Uncharacterized protein n=1 Tax=Papiliotrema laurentii TaxID=5418 RepID=A0AAD9FM00_PAPLA|nr:hypothetical protein DB88DRAFT_475194 [Papiliotrema laurentii]